MSRLELWLRYLLVWPSLPTDGPPGQPDVLIVPAFGRNRIPDNELSVLGRRLQKLGYQDDVLANALRIEGCDIGHPNRTLADLAQIMLTDVPELHAVLQWEITLGLDPSWYEKNRWRIHVVWPSPTGFGLRMREVILEAKRLIDQHRWTRPVIMTHDRLSSRAVMVARKEFGMMPRVLKSSVDWFDPYSIQPSTASRWVWLLRETPGRVHHLLHRWV